MASANKPFPEVRFPENTSENPGLKTYDLNKILTPTEAAYRWGLKENTVRAAISRGKFADLKAQGVLRQSGATWLIHEDAMYEVYGEPGNPDISKRGPKKSANKPASNANKSAPNKKSK